MTKENIKTFKEDTIVFFDRTEFNLKGYNYYILDNFCYICSSDYAKLTKELGKSYDYPIEDNSYFSEDDFEDTYNPFKESSND
jgi:hypothetical protein